MRACVCGPAWKRRMGSSSFRKKWLVVISSVLVCLLLGLTLTYLVKQKQAEKKREKARAEEAYYAELLLKYSHILFGSPLAPETQTDTQKVNAPPEQPDVYRRIENLAKTRNAAPGYIKGLATLFFVSGDVCDVLSGYNEKNSSATFFADQAKSLLNDRSDLKENPGISGFTAEERSLRQEIIKVTDGKIIVAYRKLAPKITNDKAKAGLARYLTAYVLATRSATQVPAEMDTFTNEIPPESFLPVLLALTLETRGYQSEISLCQEIINYSPKSVSAAIALESAGDLYRQMKMNADAINTYKKIVLEHSDYPGAVKAQEKIIDVYATDWKVYPNAIYECFELVKVFPKSQEAAHAQFMAGKFYYLANDYEHAISTLQNFVEQYPKTEWAPEAYLLMALNHLGKQENDIAIKQLRTLIRKYPKHDLASRAQFLVGYCFLSQQKYYDALREYQKLTVNYPDSPYAGRAKDFVEKLSKMKRR